MCGRMTRPKRVVGVQRNGYRRGLPDRSVRFFPFSRPRDGFEVFIVADACGGLTPASHELALRRLEQAGARLTA